MQRRRRRRPINIFAWAIDNNDPNRFIILYMLFLQLVMILMPVALCVFIALSFALFVAQFASSSVRYSVF